MKIEDTLYFQGKKLRFAWERLMRSTGLVKLVDWLSLKISKK